MASWYYLKNGCKYGPVSALKLKSMANNGELLESDSIWKQGMPSWQTAGTRKGLFKAGNLTAGNPTEVKQMNSNKFSMKKWIVIIGIVYAGMTAFSFAMLTLLWALGELESDVASFEPSEPDAVAEVAVAEVVGDLKKFQGTWKLLFDKNPRDRFLGGMEGHNAYTTTWIIEGDQVQMEIEYVGPQNKKLPSYLGQKPGQVRRGSSTLTIDESRQPPRFTLTDTDALLTQVGTYEIIGDRFEMCWVTEGGIDITQEFIRMQQD